MTPTIALKIRLYPGMKRTVHSRRSLLASNPYRKVSIGSVAELPTKLLKQESSENEAASLLLSMSTIVSDEMKSNDHLFDDESDSHSAMSTSTAHSIESPTTPTTADDSALFVWNRVRTVSFDSPRRGAVSPRSLAVVSPTNTPVGKDHHSVRKTSRRISQRTNRDSIRLPKMPQLVQIAEVKGQKKKALQGSVAKGITIKKILRKKFSWKNYPGKLY